MRIETGRRSVTALSTAAVALVLGISEAWAAAGRPSPWETGMQEMVTELGQSVSNFHTYLVWLITVVCLFVLALLLVIVARFNERKNPVPSQTTHNTLLEVAWTIVPVLILVAIAIPSFRLLRQQLVPPQADLVVKATGYAWYWGYEYPADQGGGFKFDSNMITDAKDLKPDQPRLLGADNAMVVPVGKIVRVQVTSADVIHAFAMPSFYIKVDAVPGRLNEVWFKAEKEGVYYGQCSELCGNGHPYMPIEIRVVSEQQFAAWLTEAKQKYASTEGSAPLKFATAQ
ncbi:cytochrome c oxidase subunit II [Microvirga tunisiensis]|uniref:Cytochrome c oxidase subunit 2 n=1 Tax=Microvirga tunisiensis TaxID=2108360 RepID=A0A5N7MHR0_9HYPH|nr:cytochrome c oxidase subunit II [Microvirga tunisiensis]MPR07588.1 cytochrome c oxidase subunit II [Microvirga tunisiensis]MPR25939.1 cytochrome c oxidase subunit II [Microvirga tunisiensis]